MDKINLHQSISTNYNEENDYKFNFKYPIGRSKILNRELFVDSMSEYVQFKKNENKVGPTSEEIQLALYGNFVQPTEGSAEYRKAAQSFLSDSAHYFKNKHFDKNKIQEYVQQPSSSTSKKTCISDTFSKIDSKKSDSASHVQGYKNIYIGSGGQTFDVQMQKLIVPNLSNGQEHTSVPLYLHGSVQKPLAYNISFLNSTAKEFVPSVPPRFPVKKSNQQFNNLEDCPQEGDD